MNWPKHSVASHHLQITAYILDHDIWDIPWSGFCLPFLGSYYCHHEHQNCLVVLHIGMLLLVCVELHKPPNFLHPQLPSPTQPNFKWFFTMSVAQHLPPYYHAEQEHHFLLIVKICICICLTLFPLEYVFHEGSDHLFVFVSPPSGRVLRALEDLISWTNEYISRH